MLPKGELFLEKKEDVRLNKYLADQGVCSRREADRLIESGKVFVDGSPAGLGDRITMEMQVVVNGKPVTKATKKVVLAFYKPEGVTCTEKDEHAEITITEYMNYPIRVTYAGRLDKESEGLMLMSNDGDLIQKITRAEHEHEKEYQVKLHKKITPEFLEQMKQGVFLKELKVKTKPCQIRQTGPYSVEIVLTQGLNRQIRRMCKELGYQVVKLKRTRIMNIRLDGLKYGEYRELTEAERTELYQLCEKTSTVKKRSK